MNTSVGEPRRRDNLVCGGNNRYSLKMHVFTYGTLMFPQVWQAVVGREFRAVGAVLAGYAIYRVQDAVFPGITASDAGGCVCGVVYLDVDHASLVRLDRFEDDFYERRTVHVACDDGEARDAEAYVVPQERRAVLTNDPWQADEFVASGGLEEFIRRFQGFARLVDGA